jgi:hypothetical protein
MCMENKILYGYLRQSKEDNEGDSLREYFDFTIRNIL